MENTYEESEQSLLGIILSAFLLILFSTQPTVLGLQTHTFVIFGTL